MRKTIVIDGKEYVFTCEEEVSADLTKLSGGETELYRVTLKWDKPVIPKKVRLAYRIPSVDMHSMWDCGRKERHIVYWNDHPLRARLASWMPVVEFISKSGLNRYCLAVQDVKTPTATEFRVDYKTMEMEIIVSFFDGVVSPISSYETLIRIDKRALPFDDAIRSAREWYDGFGYKPSSAPEAATLPMYSTWYSYYQDITQADVLAECRLAKKMGMETVIVDDGWQTGDSTVVYGYTGDWKPYLPKFPDYRKLSDELHAIGMKIMVWFAMPFVGYYSENYEKFRGKYLCNNDNSNCSTLDPRFKEVRDFTVQTYVRAVKDWNLDGLKLDFIDRFVSNGAVTDEMDFVSVEDATEQLLKDITAALKVIKSDILIEFRQPYMGPVISSYGNMIRVWDCPDDGWSNKVCTLELRLTSGSCAVHSDMLGWGKDDSPQAVAVQLLMTLFSVPQISVRLAEINAGQKKTLTNYLDYWTAHRKIILNGKLTIKNPENFYTYAEAVLGTEKVAAAYSSNLVDARGFSLVDVFNVSGENLLILKSDGGTVTVFDCMGEEISAQKVQSGLSEIAVPMAGRLSFKA